MTNEDKQKYPKKEEACSSPLFLFSWLDCDVMAGFPAAFLDHEMTLEMEVTCGKAIDKKLVGLRYHGAP